MKDIREPKQQRSIEKKNKIIKAGYELFCEKGYYKTNTAEIAKRAGVSTGIVYNYFVDKKDIFISVLYYLKDTMQHSMLLSLQKVDPTIDLNSSIRYLIDTLLDLHLSMVKVHEEIIAMTHLDSDVNNYLKEIEEQIIEQLAEFLVAHNIIIEYPHEKIHVAYDLVENYCHENIYHDHKCLDSGIMKEIIIDTIVHIIK